MCTCKCAYIILVYMYMLDVPFVTFSHFILCILIYVASPNVAPTNFRVIDRTLASLSFQWDALSNEQANGVVKRYVVTCIERNNNREVSKINVSVIRMQL